MLIALDIGHRGKPSRLRDRGVVRDGVEETDLTTRYAVVADRELRRLGHECILLGDGEYADRWARADGYGAAVYAQLHVNAGGGDRGEVFYDHRSSRGAKLAQAVAVELSRTWPWPSSAKACRPDTNNVARDGDYSEAYNCIRGVKAVAVVLEPYFIDGPRAARFLVEAEYAGVALARGIHAWSKESP